VNIVKLPKLLKNDGAFAYQDCLNSFRVIAPRLGASRTPLPAAVVRRGIGFQWPRRFASRSCINFANAIPAIMNRHSTTKMTKPFAGVGTFSGNFTIIGMISCTPANSAH
jgi:hypothetical protein